jgi:hypothetical protein
MRHAQGLMPPELPNFLTLSYLKPPLTLERYRFGPAGPHLDQFTDWLEAREYQSDRSRHRRV